MKQISLKLFALLLVFGNALQLNLFAQNNYGLDGEKLRERIKRLSADDFEGRGPGLAGSKRAADYIAAQLKGIGLLPGNRSSYFQEVPMVSVKADPNTKLLASASGKSAMLNFGDDFVATTGSQMQRVAIDSELVFMGYGISAPEYKWNDYKGSTNDYRGKILLIMVNDPPATAAEPNLFGGRALTYYGRWTYKYEEAARRGAAGVILIHTTESAGYGWNVVRTSFGGVRSEIFRSSSDKTPFLSLMSWTTNEAAARLLALANLNLDELRAAAASRDFKPVKTGIRVKLDLRLDLKRFSSPNILGIIPGRDPKLKNQYVVFSAHWDHLGIGEPDKKGDKIYNGAYDNASGVAALLTIAERIKSLKGNSAPKRSILFLFPTAEEQGLLGTEYFTRMPTVPLRSIAGNVNVDGVNPFGVTKDFSALGAERSTMDEIVNQVARDYKLELKPDNEPEKGFFFRSDHFPFAKVGVPAISLRHGEEFVNELKGQAAEFYKNYTALHYHQPSDEFHDWWDTGALLQNTAIAMEIGLRLANVSKMPHYKDGDEFAPADRRRMGGKK